MNSLLTTLSSSMPLFLTLTVVLLLRRLRVFKPGIEDAVAPLLFKFVLPFFVFSIMYSLSFQIADWPVLVTILALNLLQLPLLVLLGRKLKIKKPVIGAILLLALAYSVGPIAYPFVELNFEQAVFDKVVSIDIVLFVTIMVLGPIISSVLDSTKKASVGEVIETIVTDPVLVAVFAGSMLNIAPIRLPVSVVDSIEFIGNTFTFLVSVYIGLTLTKPDLSDLRLMIVTTVGRLLFALGVSYIVITLLQPSPEMTLAIPLTLFIAFSSFPLVYTERYSLDSELVAQVSVFSRIVVYLLYPVLITLLKGFAFV